MNYIKHYIKLIRKAQSTIPIGYCENHHVFPVSIFGKNDFIVKLTARQHYIAHALLEKIYIKRYGLSNTKTHKMIHAFFMMNNAQGKGQERYTNSKLFEASKIRYCSKPSHLLGKKRTLTEQHLANLRASKKSGKDNPLYGIPRSNEVVGKMSKPKQAGHGAAVSASRKGMKFSQEHIENLKKSHQGQVAWNKGKVLSAEHKKRLSTAHKNKDKSYMTDEYRKKLAEATARVWAKRKVAKIQEQLNGSE